MSKKKSTKQQILDKCITYLKRSGELPTTNSLLDMGYVYSTWRHHFGTLEKLYNAMGRDTINKYLGKPGYHPNATRELIIKEKGIYIITSHQNDTKINTKFLNALLMLKLDLKATLIVIPTYYQTRSTMGRLEPKWSDELMQYYRSQPFKLTKNLEVCAGLPINATAVNPLSGLHAVTGTSSSIIPHPQIRWEYVPTPPDEISKVLMTTGSISQKNYTRTKAGALGAYRHENSALVIYTENDMFWPFIVNADNTGGFYHLEHYYDADGVYTHEDGYALTMGDLHCEYMDPGVEEATWTGKNALVKKLPITKQIWHDVIDFTSAHSHHNKRNLIYKHALNKAGRGSAKWSLDTTAEKVSKLIKESPKTDKFYIVSSNHHDHLNRFLNEIAPKDLDGDDLQLWVDLMSNVLREVKVDRMGVLHGANILKLYLSQTLPKELFNKLDWTANGYKKLMIYGIDHGQHGHVGPNGGPANRNAYAASTHLNNICHSHSPGITFGTYQGGTNSYLQRGYNPGYSSWMHVDILTYPNGKRTPISIIDKRWRP